jgi:hypothetical protein
MNYKNVKHQLYQIIVTEIAKYYQKSISPAGLSLEDLKALELLSKISNFEENIKVPNTETKPKSDKEIKDLLKIVQSSPYDPGTGGSES